MGMIQPLTITALNPACATAAPPYPPISACEELVGNPNIKVMRFQLMAPNNPASNTFSFTISMWTIPLTMVFATARVRSFQLRLMMNAVLSSMRSGSPI